MTTRELLDGARARVIAPLGDAYRTHARRMPLEHHANGVHAVDGLGALPRRQLAPQDFFGEREVDQTLDRVHGRHHDAQV